ncbi:MAG: protein-L-isoaspartate(D-aspartate) O-methyltransferase [Pseudomonadota bacterium]
MFKKSLIILLVLSSSLPLSKTWSADGDEFQTLRSNMVREIFADVQLTRLKIGQDTLDSKVMKAMAEVPRHLFVPDKQRDYAYENRPLSIGYGQTISQPYIVALMTDLLQPDERDIVLEIGTGSGYQAAILAGLVNKVYTIEIIEALGEAASDRLAGLGYDNITTRIGDGYYGWKEYAPFDTIIVTAAAGSIPPPLIRQLKRGGRMIIPVGGAFLTQQLILIEKDLEGKIKTRQILPVRFVPLTRSRTAD